MRFVRNERNEMTRLKRVKKLLRESQDETKIIFEDSTGDEFSITMPVQQLEEFFLLFRQFVAQEKLNDLGHNETLLLSEKNKASIGIMAGCPSVGADAITQNVLLKFQPGQPHEATFGLTKNEAEQLLRFLQTSIERLNNRLPYASSTVFIIHSIILTRVSEKWETKMENEIKIGAEQGRREFLEFPCIALDTPYVAEIPENKSAVLLEYRPSYSHSCENRQ